MRWETLLVVGAFPRAFREVVAREDGCKAFLLPSCKGARSCGNVHGRVATPLFASDGSEFSQRFIFRFSASCVRQGGGNASSHRYSSLLPQRSRFSGRLGVVSVSFVPVPVTCVRRLPKYNPAGSSLRGPFVTSPSLFGVDSPSLGGVCRFSHRGIRSPPIQFY